MRNRFLFATLCAGLLATPAAAQIIQSDADRDKWQRPAEVLDALGVKPGGTFADIGAGRGYFTAKLAQAVGATGTVYAVDLTAPALRELHTRFDTTRVAHVNIVASSDTSIALPDRSVDGILIVDAYHEFVHFDAMLTSIARALRPGGRLVIIDPAGGPRNTAERQAAMMKGLEIPTVREYYQTYHFLPKDTLLADMTRNGFALVRELPDMRDPQMNDMRGPMYFLVFERKP